MGGSAVSSDACIAQVARHLTSLLHSAVLPLLPEEQKAGQSRTSTVEERVIGVGLQALDGVEDGAAVRDLFQMLAVTQEDFVHPMAVIELLWRSCCASESEKREGSLTTRLKVRQQTQILVDHSLLLGSTSGGIHLHDVVLQYLRKRNTADEMREQHVKVVNELIRMSNERPFEDTGSTPKAFDGEEGSAPLTCV